MGFRVLGFRERRPAVVQYGMFDKVTRIRRKTSLTRRYTHWNAQAPGESQHNWPDNLRTRCPSPNIYSIYICTFMYIYACVRVLGCLGTCMYMCSKYLSTNVNTRTITSFRNIFMYVCMYACTYVCLFRTYITHAYIHTNIYICVCVLLNAIVLDQESWNIVSRRCTWTCMHVCMYARMHACMYVCMCMCKSVCIYERMQNCTNYEHIHTYIYICMLRNTCIHTYIHYKHTHIYIYR